MKIAVIGSGIAGLAVAHQLRHSAYVTLYEAGSYFGGHAHTVDVVLPGADGLVTHGVDTGFLVFNERTYPLFIQLLVTLGVRTCASDMSFSVQVPAAFRTQGLEWSGTSLNTVFAQRANLLNPRFWGMLADLLRFNALCTRLAKAGADRDLTEPLADFLDRHRFGTAFRQWYLLPMLGCIWSCPTDQMLRFPLSTMVRFCHNHGLLQIQSRPRWYTVAGGSRHYVDKIVAGIADKRLNTPVRRIERGHVGVRVATDHGVEGYDHVVLATHTDQSLALLAAPTAAEREVLGAIGYQPNRAVLHTDASVLPRRRAAWAAWNYEQAVENGAQPNRVCLHYLINQLQPLPFLQPVVVSLNPAGDIAPEHVLGEYAYTHPVFDLAAMQAQRRIPALQGHQRTWFCGAWTGYGFHEDGLQSGLAVARQLQEQMDAPVARARHDG